MKEPVKEKPAEQADKNSGAFIPLTDLQPPKQGFSRGTVQGLIVCVPLLLILLLTTLFKSIEPQSGLAVTLDFVAGFVAAVAVVWVIGGLFEFQGRIFDISVKAAGGAAVLLFLVAWVRPYYNSANYAPYSIVMSVGPGEPLGNLLDKIADERRQGKLEVTFDFGGEEDAIRNYIPVRDTRIQYKANSWQELFKYIAQDSEKCLEIQVSKDKLSFLLKKDRWVEAQEGPGGQFKVVVCK